MRGWHGTMNRVSTAEQVMSVHVQPTTVCTCIMSAALWTWAFSLSLSLSLSLFLKKNTVNLNKHPPASDVELKVFSIGLFGGCHPCMRTHREDHSSPGNGNPPGSVLAEKKKTPSLRNPSLSLLPFGAVRVEEEEGGGGGGGEGEALCDRVCVHRCRRPLRKRIQRNVLRPVLHIMRSFWGNQTVQERENLRCCGGMRALDVRTRGCVHACAAFVRACVRESIGIPKL